MIEAFQSQPVPAETMFPRTKYYVVDSVKAGARYAIWVTVPASYDKHPDDLFPAIYTPDGNRAAALVPTIGNAGFYDPINPVLSSVQVSIGYIGDEAGDRLAVRARDLLPPKEKVQDGMEEGVRSMVPAGLMTADAAELYIRNLKNPAGDRFLAFLTEELHPFILANYRIDPAGVGLFGHSYGGLFATYVAMQKSTIFKYVGASSPGILSNSVVFQMYEEALANGGLSDRKLHMTVASREITAPTVYQGLVGEGTVKFIALAGVKPLEGLAFSSHLIEHESHMSAEIPAMYSFLRTCYPVKA